MLGPCFVGSPYRYIDSTLRCLLGDLFFLEESRFKNFGFYVVSN